MAEALYLIDADSLMGNSLEKALSLIDPARREKALRYVKESDTRLSVAASLLLTLLKGKDLKVTKTGKPYFEEGPKFCLSHSGHYSCLYASDEDVGVDIQKVDPKDYEYVKACFSEEELQGIDGPESFALAWAKKEACAKCEGLGLFDPKKQSLRQVENSVYEYEGRTYRVEAFLWNGYAVAMAKKGQGEFPKPTLVETKEFF